MSSMFGCAPTSAGVTFEEVMALGPGGDDLHELLETKEVCPSLELKGERRRPTGAFPAPPPRAEVAASELQEELFQEEQEARPRRRIEDVVAQVLTWRSGGQKTRKRSTRRSTPGRAADDPVVRLCYDRYGGAKMGRRSFVECCRALAVSPRSAELAFYEAKRTSRSSLSYAQFAFALERLAVQEGAVKAIAAAAALDTEGDLRRRTPECLVDAVAATSASAVTAECELLSDLTVLRAIDATQGKLHFIFTYFLDGDDAMTVDDLKKTLRELRVVPDLFPEHKATRLLVTILAREHHHHASSEEEEEEEPSSSSFVDTLKGLLFDDDDEDNDKDKEEDDDDFFSAAEKRHLQDTKDKDDASSSDRSVFFATTPTAKSSFSSSSLVCRRSLLGGARLDFVLFVEVLGHVALRAFAGSKPHHRVRALFEALIDNFVRMVKKQHARSRCVPLPPSPRRMGENFDDAAKPFVAGQPPATLQATSSCRRAKSTFVSGGERGGTPPGGRQRQTTLKELCPRAAAVLNHHHHHHHTPQYY